MQQKYKDSGRPIYHCKWHYLHIYFTKEKLEQHEKVCRERVSKFDNHYFTYLLCLFLTKFHGQDEKFEKEQEEIRLIQAGKTKEQICNEEIKALAKWQNDSDG